MGNVLAFTHQLETTCCCSCGIEFAFPASLMRDRRNDKKTFHCPNGHPQSFTESEADRLRRELKVAAEILERERGWLAQARKEAVAQRAQATKARNQLERVKNGVCPCCRRSFQNLRRHIETKHPGFQPQAEAPVS